MFIKSNLIGVSFLLILGLLSFTFKTAEAQSTGKIHGTVYDAETGVTMVGVSILLKGTQRGAATDRTGQFTFSNLSEGDYTLVFKYIGYETKQLEIEVEEGETETVEVKLEPQFQQLQKITVTGIRQGQAAAINAQKNAKSIKNVISSKLMDTFASSTVGQSLRFIPGVNMQEDMGEARYIRIRGMKPSLVNVEINGVKTGSPEGDTRAVTLDMIPSGLLSKISVSKTLTPDMSADAIGGTVNLVTKSALTQNRLFNITISGAYNNSMQKRSKFGGRISASYGQRFGNNNQFGFRIGGTHSIDPVSVNDIEMEYNHTNNSFELDNIEFRNYVNTRYRTGINASLDYRFNKKSKLYLNAFYNHYKDHEDRHAFKLEQTYAGRELKIMHEKNQIISAQIGGVQNLGSRFEIDYQFAYSHASQVRKPPMYHFAWHLTYEDDSGNDISFITFDRSKRVRFPKFYLSPAVPDEASVYNYSAYKFDILEHDEESSYDARYVPKIDMFKKYTLGSSINGVLQFGFKGSFVEKGQDIFGRYYKGYKGSTTFDELVGGYTYDGFLKGRYAPNGIGYFPFEKSLHKFIVNNKEKLVLNEVTSKVGSNGEDYHVTENTYAGYIMTTVQLGKFDVIGGVRYVHIASSYRSNAINISKDRAVTVSPASAEKTNDFILPSINIKYSINTQNILRVAWTKSYAKPSVWEIVPHATASSAGENYVELGNPNLEPMHAMNIDVIASHYFSSIGVASVNAFYKKIKNFIYTKTFIYSEEPYKGYEATQPLNGKYANLYGISISYQNQLTFLPGFLSGFGLYANYTYIYSEAYIQSKENGSVTTRQITMPGQAGNVGSVSISYQRGGFNGRVSYNFSDEYVAQTRTSQKTDRYYGAQQELSVSLSQHIGSHWMIFVNGNNLTNEPLIYYEGVTARPEQISLLSFKIKLGLKFKL